MRGGLEDFSLLLRRWLFTAIWMGLMLYASTDVASGAHTSSGLRQILADLGIHLTDQMVANLNLFIRKGAHVTEFAILAILLWRDGEPLLRRRGPGYEARLAGLVMVISIAFAALSETVQRFFPSREPSIHDVLINTSGAALGLLIIWSLRLRKPISTPGRTTVLFTSDLHLDTERTSLGQLKDALAKTSPDVCVVAGDLGTADRAEDWLSELKKATEGTRLVVCLGNQDHWVDRDRHVGYASPAEIREKIWRPALNAAGISCLDFGNVELDDLVLTGGYGHFDLGMQAPGFALAGQTPMVEDYQRGEFHGLVSNDLKYLPNGAASLAQEARFQAKGIANRLAKAHATGKRVLLVTHTVPFPALIPRVGSVTRPARFLDAYAGNALLSKELAPYRGKIELAVCGHTHVQVPLKIVNGIPCINIGSEYGALGFVFYDAARKGQAPETFRAEQSS
ncbi:hypothetical protein BH09VER1_BH09VER1_52590 [soil metagenome]